VVHLWGAADSPNQDISSDAAVVHTKLSDVGGRASASAGPHYSGSNKIDALVGMVPQ